MSLKRVRILLLVLGTAGLSGGLLLVALSEGTSSAAGRSPVGDVRSVRAVSYVLTRGAWTTFRIPAEKGVVKLLTNASVASEYRDRPRYSAGYAVKYRVLEGGQALQDDEYVFRSRFEMLENADGVPVVPAKLYLDPKLAPLGSRMTMLNLGESSGRARELKLSLSWAEPGIQDVVCRVFVQDSVPSYKLDYFWDRMSRETRRRLARGNIYGPDMLTETERRNILENRWRPVGPQGVAGSDYEDRAIYTVQREERFGEDAGPAWTGLTSGPDLLAVVPILEGGGCIRLEFDRSAAPAARGPTRAMVSWLGREPGERLDRSVEILDRRSLHRDDFGDGFLVVWSEERLIVRAFLEAAGEDVDLTPRPECVAGFLGTAESGVEFAKSGARRAESPMRFDVRRILGWETDPEDDARLEYELLGDAGESLGRGQVAVSPRASEYDSLIGAADGGGITDATRCYFVLGPEHAAIRLWSGSPGVLITGYTRPDGLHRSRRVPEEYFKTEEVDDENREWFFVRPRNYLDCLRSGREFLLSIQKRPTAVREEVWSGDFTVRIHEPTGPWSAFRLLEPEGKDWRGDSAPPRAGLARLLVGERSEVSFRGLPGDPLVAPRCILVLGSASPADVEPNTTVPGTDGAGRLSIRVDGREVLSRPAMFPEEELSLPPFPPGRHEVSIDSELPVAAWVGPVERLPKETWRERTVYLLDARGLSFDIPKRSAGPTRLSVRLYQPAWNVDRIQVTALIEGIRRRRGVPLGSWTFASTRFSVRDATGEPLPLLGAGGATVAGGTTFFVEIGTDLSPGTYRVRLSVPDGTRCWVQVSEVEPRAGSPSAGAASEGMETAAGGPSVR